MLESPKLTARQQQILDLIQSAIARTGAPPTRAEIATELGFKSANAAEEHLQALARKGVIELVSGTSRGIRLKSEALRSINESRNKQYSFQLPSLAQLALPLIGRVAAGSPILAQEHIDQTYYLESSLFQRKPDYLLKVRGMSMRDAGIMDGDLLAVQSTKEAKNGQIVVARLGDELGVGCIKYNVVQPTARGEALHESGEALAVAELIALGHVVERDLDAQVAPRLVFDYPLAFRSLRRLSAGENGGRCGILGIMGLLATGHYAVCGIGTQVPGLVFGRIGEDGLRRIWLEHPLLLELRAGLPSRLPGVCADCLMLEQCLGSCIAQTYYTNGTLWAPYWFCDAASREGLFPESRTRTGAEPAAPCVLG